MVHDKKDKGDLGVAKTLVDLTVKGFAVFVPAITEHLPFDLIAYKDNKCFRIQCKHSVSGEIFNKTVWNDKKGLHTNYYNENDFDYYAIYLSVIDKVIYPNISFGGRTITFSIPNSATPFYWWEDFVNFTDDAVKKTYKDFNHKLIRKSKSNL